MASGAGASSGGATGAGSGAGIGSPRCSSPKQGQKTNKQIVADVADVAEPIWLKADKEEACWHEPDEVFATKPVVSDKVDHGSLVAEKCRCGCVPDILSLFEMAALRAKHRAKQAIGAQKI